jgi:hypothetical protein
MDLKNTADQLESTASKLSETATDLDLAIARIELKQEVVDSKLLQLRSKIARLTHPMDDKARSYFEAKVAKLIEEHDLPSNPYPDMIELLTEAWSLGRVSAVNEAVTALRTIKGRP